MLAYRKINIFIKESITAINSTTGRNTQRVIVGQILNSLGGFALNIVLMRELSVQAYGVFALFSSTLMLIAGFLHFGWIETFVRFGSMYLGSSSFRDIKQATLQKILRGSLITVLCLVLCTDLICKYLYKRSDFALFFIAAALGAFFTNLCSFIQNIFRTKGEYQSYNRLQTHPTLARLLAVCIIFLSLTPSVGQAILIYTIVPMVFCTLYLRAEIFDFRSPSVFFESNQTGIEMKKYNSWIFISMITTHLIGNIDAQILAHYKDDPTLSAYGAAARLTLPIRILVTALTTTLLPRLCATEDHSEIKRFFKVLLPFLSLISIMIIACVWIAPPLLIWIAGSKHTGIEALLKLNIFNSLIIFLANTTSLALYAWGESKALAYLNVLQLLVFITLCLSWIPIRGAAGAIEANIAINVIGLAFILWNVMRGFRFRSIKK